jgi:hypothetical protein
VCVCVCPSLPLPLHPVYVCLLAAPACGSVGVGGRDMQIIDGRVLCVHGGLSPDVATLDQIATIQRCQEVPHEGSFCGTCILPSTRLRSVCMFESMPMSLAACACELKAHGLPVCISQVRTLTGDAHTQT